MFEESNLILFISIITMFIMIYGIIVTRIAKKLNDALEGKER